MAGNTFGKLFKVTTWGESHGMALGAVIDGCPPGYPLDEKYINTYLEKRRPGKKHTTSRNEPDKIKILSGTFEGFTTGTPLSLAVFNEDIDSSPYEWLRDIFRPGHADFTYQKKYGIRDHRGGGRSSARETVSRVAAGAVADLILKRAGINVMAFTSNIGGVQVKAVNLDNVMDDPLFCPDPQASEKMQDLMQQVKSEGDSLGGTVDIIVAGCPAGLGEPVFDKTDALLAHALMSIGAVKGVEVGAGFKAALLRGSQNNDEMDEQGFMSNKSGGILGGISTGHDICLRVAVKPIPSIAIQQKTVNIENRKQVISIKGRHDISAIPRIIPVCEAMARLVIVDLFLQQQIIEKIEQND